MNRKRESYSLYQEAYSAYIESNYELFDKLRMSNKLSNIEKKLLNARRLLNKRKLDESMNLLSTLRVSKDDTFFWAEFHLIKAAVSSWKGLRQEAFINYSIALNAYIRIEDRIGQFSCHYNISVNSNRLGLSKIAVFHLEMSKEFADSNRDLSLVYRGLACEYSKENKELTSIKMLEKSLELKESLNEVDNKVLFSVASDIYYRFGQKEKALSCINELRSNYTNFESPRVLLQFHILKNITEGSKLGALPLSLKESEEYSMKWNLIVALEKSNFSEARLIWYKLKIQQPLVFDENFKPINNSDSKSIFFEYISILTNKTQKSDNDLSSLKPKSKGYKLVALLQDTAEPISKAELVEKIWNKEYSYSDDSRFYQLIRSVKIKTSICIVNNNGHYFISK